MKYEELEWFDWTNYRNNGCLIDRTDYEDENFKILGRAPNRKRQVMWNCLCKHCNEYCVKTFRNLQRDTSCGCLKGKIIGDKLTKDITGQVFGYLTALYKVGSNISQNAIWHCRCICGNECDVDANNLRSLHTVSCGCIKREKSVGAINITNILKENNVIFKAEISFKDLTGKQNHPYWYDFGIYNKNNELIRLIEYDGIQHYQETWGKWKTNHTLEDQIYRDNEKNKYALKRNIPLVRIPYWERDNITLEMIMGNKYLVKEEN